MRNKIILMVLMILLIVPVVYAVTYKTVYNPFTGKLDYVISDNQSGQNFTFANITADYFYGDGSLLTGISSSSSQWNITGSDWIYNNSGALDWNETKGNATYIQDDDETSLNVNSSIYWNTFQYASDLNYYILSYWANITDKPQYLSNFTNDIDLINSSYANNTYILQSEEGNLNVNSSGYWDDLNTPSDISTGDLTDDDTYIKADGTNPLTANWDAGNFNIAINTSILDTIYSTGGNVTINDDVTTTGNVFVGDGTQAFYMQNNGSTNLFYALLNDFTFANDTTILGLLGLTSGTTVNDIDIVAVDNDNALITSGGVYDLLGDCANGEFVMNLTTGGPECYTDQDTTYTAGGTLLQLAGTEFSVDEGTLTDDNLCNYEATGTQLDCDNTLDASGQCTGDVCGGGHSHPASEVTAGTFDSGNYVFSGGTLDADTLNTGQGDYELYAMNQDVESTDSPSFAGISLTENSFVTANKKLYFDGGGNTYITEPSSDVLDFYVGGVKAIGITESTSADVVFSDKITSDTLNTGQGDNELYDMDQNVLTTSDVTFNNITAQNVTVNRTCWNSDCSSYTYHNGTGVVTVG